MNKSNAMELILKNINVKKEFLKDDVEILVTTDLKAATNLSDHYHYDWEEVVEFGIKQIVITPYVGEYDFVKYDEVTAVIIRYDNKEHPDSEVVINHKEQIINVIR